jgi:GT2 family glycosyltransferase
VTLDAVTKVDTPARSTDDATPTSLRVAIVLYENSLEDLWRCMRSLTRSIERTFVDLPLPPNVVTISVGDCSDQPVVGEAGLRELSRLAGERVHVEYDWFGRNHGHSAGSNRLAAEAAEDALLFLNPDCYVSPRLVPRMLRTLKDPSIAMADARQIPCEHPKWYDPVVGDQSWASGACLIVRTPWFRQADGFDAVTFPSYVNDVDLSWRIRLAGGRVVHQPRAVVFHDKRLTKTAQVNPTRVELYEGMLGGLLLATRYGRADVVEETMDAVREHGTSEQNRAVREFERRSEKGELPAPVDGADLVAEFVAGEYGARRF